MVAALGHHAPQEQRGDDVGRAVHHEGRTNQRPQRGHQQPGSGIAQQVGERLGDGDRRVGGHEVRLIDDQRHDRVFRWAEQDAHCRDGEGQDVDQPDVDVRGNGHQQHQPRTDNVAADHRQSSVPSVRKRSGERAEHDVGHRGHGEGNPHLQRVAPRRHQECECHLVDAIAEQAHQLPDP